MPSFKPFSSVTGRSSYSLFDVRLDSDFIVFRGNEHESAGQLLKGTLVLCLSSSLKIEDVRLRLVGTLRHVWTDPRGSAPGVSNQKVDKSTTILEHRWAPFIGTHGKSMTLPAGNYEWPFEYMLPGNIAESVEGIPEASIAYRLRATVGRGKLAYDLHANKHLRIIRTLEPGALEFLHAMSVENIWPNKVDYSIVIPQKAVVFGGYVSMEMRFTPLLKGLELGDITARMMEVRECCVTGSTGLNVKEHRVEREVSMWKFQVSRELHWQDMIEDTGQDGWALTKKLDLPKKLRQCVQDVNHNGIKVRHKIKLTVALRNPDGHISELRATLPVSIFISPNMPLNENGDLVDQSPSTTSNEQELGTIAPPGYGEHVLDQLYEDVDVAGFQTPGFQTPGIQSGVNSPFYAQSRSGSSDNLAGLAHSRPVAPAALSSRLANVSLDPSQRNISFGSLGSAGFMSPTSAPQTSSAPAPRSEPASAALTRSNSAEDDSSRNSAEHVDFDPEEFQELNKVPSYQTAVRTPARSRAGTGDFVLPDYQTALNATRTPPALDNNADPLGTISEDQAGEDHQQSATRPGSVIVTGRSYTDDPANYRRMHLVQGRNQVY